MSELPKDVVVLPEADDRWVVMNVFTRTSLGVESSALGVLRSPEKAADGTQRYRVWEIEWFSNYAGLLADPSRYKRNVAEWPECETLDHAALVARFEKHSLLVRDAGAYAKKFGPKTSLIDAEHIGTFHQQVGQQLMLTYRESPSAWWLKQKFTEDLRSVRDNLYGAIQFSFLKDYFPARLKAGDRILDVGCGTGIYSNLMAASGAEVVGVDPSEEYVGIGRERAKSGVELRVLPVGSPGAFDGLPESSFDFVFMSDALLFYFVAFSNAPVPDIAELFAGIRRVLKPGGTFISLEPHAVFWLLPWLGEEERPFTIMTEYTKRLMRVNPTTSELVHAFASGGFVVADMKELRPAPGSMPDDRRAWCFADQFPLWQLFELRKASG